MYKGRESRCSPVSLLQRRQELISTLPCTDFKKNVHIYHTGEKEPQQKTQHLCYRDIFNKYSRKSTSYQKGCQDQKEPSIEQVYISKFFENSENVFTSLMGKLQCYKKVAICRFLVKHIFLKWSFNPQKGAGMYRHRYR